MIQFSNETRAKVAELCKMNKVRELSLFGSRARGESRTDSDYDLLVVGSKVDLVDKKGLKHLIPDEVLAEAEVIYAV